ncbi:GH116 family glycosyl-hydrolase [Maribacter polysaccharolyticus]|uniref:GH116 family glycosyl-hydrolase n=1 Tax=Maribacter polysaccharolyticus TaxID=3020831 RepID=UPI00237F1A15|nr:GH116 family glycosyl-hydrolase [Maribacter polysaccharolyticus]MDE3742687.1 GH116 family glycosyl-hydrolase [Maribacter polysaccharolyticus]
MKKIQISLLFLMMMMGCLTAQDESLNWPVLKTYDQDHIQKIKMPVGGIGTGTISLTGRGSLEDWEIMNRPAKGFNPTLENWGPAKQKGPFFAIFVEDGQGKKQTRLLEGPPDESYYEGAWGATSNHHGLPRFSNASFKTAYPFGQVFLSDENLPVEVVVGAYNPLIPGNIDDSSIPMAILDYTVKNSSDRDIAISLAGTIQNFIGFDGTRGKAIKNVNTIREENGVNGIHYTSNGVDPESEQWGTMSFVSLNEGTTTYRTAWQPKTSRWDKKRLDFWDDFSADGLLEKRENEGANAPMGTLAVKTTLKAGEEKTFRFLISWHFPNRQTWDKPGFQKLIKATVGNYYTTKYSDSWDVISKTLPRLNALENSTKTFVNALLNSDIPEVIKESALFNLAHLRTQLAFRIKSGQLLGWEGLFDTYGSCFGSCTHVWNYEQTTAFLFGELAKTMREVEYKYATDDTGLMSFRVYLPLEEGQLWGKAAADGQMGSIMKFYRDWQLSGDDAFLKQHWPKVKKSLEFCWIPGGWDADKNGVMEGSQHNTMDVEYFGPNPQMGFWYLGALKASEEMATYLGEKAFAKTCHDLYGKGSKWMDENLFNGEYYEQHIQPPMSADNVAESLIGAADVKNAIDFTSPDFQLGKGVLVDQLVGQVFSHIVGLGYLAKEENIKKTLESIMKYNYVENMTSHANFHRSYALGDESALLMAAYPKERPEKPFPYYTEVMTGFEYTAAVGMLQEGLLEDGLLCINNIRDRYDGKKRSPFNEAEAGHHYARSMMAWAGILAITKFQYSAVDKSMTFTSKPGTYFWSNGYGYGTVQVKNKEADIAVLSGKLELDRFILDGVGTKKLKMKTINASETLNIKW